MQFPVVSIHVYLIGFYLKIATLSITGSDKTGSKIRGLHGESIECINTRDEETESVRSKFQKPNVIFKGEFSFDLNIDDRYPFKPGFAMAPFSTVGEPWPLPKYYKTEKVLLKLQESNFKFSLLKNKPCDILKEAIRRYEVIIQNYIPEEHYDFPFNFNEKTLVERMKEIENKYKTVANLPDLEILVSDDGCGYPHIDMDESYKLVLRPDVAKLTAKEIWGVLRGLETFSQLLFRKRDTNDVYAKVTEIVDEPRFPHRGIMIDTARHYIYKNTIKDVLDGMAYNKLNILHWHIVDDNSFPYQSKVFPKLSEKAAFHPSLVYTLHDIKEIVEYATYRGIRVVPEFDTPGHSFAWFGYPEIVSTCYQGKDFVGPLGPINPAQNETYTFMGKLFSEIFDIFPETFVHLGGDELQSTCWTTNPQITSFLQTYGGIPAAEAKRNPRSYIGKATGYYFKRLIAALQATAREKKKKKAFIMWEDALENTGDVPSDSIVQLWIRSKDEIRSINRRGYRAIYSSCWYLDIPTKKCEWSVYYKCDPSPYKSEDEEKGKVLGGEACLWTEYVTSDSLMTVMWPRASLTAERLWSPKSTTDIMSAGKRIEEQRCRMISRGLSTGHISGPDYCLRSKHVSLGKSNDSSPEPEVIFKSSRRIREVGGSVGGEFILHPSIPHYWHLPAVSILLCMVGMYCLIIKTKFGNLRTNLYRMKSFISG